MGETIIKKLVKKRQRKKAEYAEFQMINTNWNGPNIFWTSLYIQLRPCLGEVLITYPARNYMFKVNNGNSKMKCEICSKLTTNTSERSQWRHSGVFIVNFEHGVFAVNFEHNSQLFLVFLLLTLSRLMPARIW